MIGKLSTLDQIRKDLQQKGTSEWAILHESEDLKQGLDEIHALHIKINNEKAKAIDDINKKYADELNSLEENYALILKLTAG